MPWTVVVNLFLLVILFLLLARHGAATGAVQAAAQASLPTIKIQLQADGRGDLAGILLNRRPVRDFDDLRRHLPPSRAVARSPRSSSIATPT